MLYCRAVRLCPVCTGLRRQEGTPRPLRSRVTAVAKLSHAFPIALYLVLSAPEGYGQAPPASSPDAEVVRALPAYDVVSIKPNRSGTGNVSISTQYQSFTASNVSLKTLLSNAYDFREGLISGLPGWAGSARYDVNARSWTRTWKHSRNLRRSNARRCSSLF